MDATYQSALLAAVAFAAALTTLSVSADPADQERTTTVPVESTLDSNLWREHWHGAMRAELRASVEELGIDAADAVQSGSRESIRDMHPVPSLAADHQMGERPVLAAGSRSVERRVGGG